MRRLLVPVLALALAGALVFDSVAAPQPRAPRAVEVVPTGLSVVCPLAADPLARSFVHLANFGDGPAQVRLTVVGRKGTPFVSDRRLGAGAARTVRVSGRVGGRASAIVDAVGGEVVVSHSLWYRARRRTGLLRSILHARGGAAAPCARSGAAELVIPHLSTRDADATIALFNPGAADAQISIALIAGNRTVRPVRLSDRRIPSRRHRVYSIGDFVFNADEVTAVVRHSAGRVTAEAQQVTRSGVALVPGVAPAASPRVVSGATGRGATLGVASTGGADTGLSANVIGRQDQGRARGIPADLAPSSGSVRSARSIDGGGPAGYALDTTVGGPLGVGARWRIARGASRDIAATAHGPQADRWAAAFGPVTTTAFVRAVIVNPGTDAVQVRIRRLGGEGAEDLMIPGGRLRRSLVSRGKGPVAILVEADGPVIVMIEASASETVGGLRTAYGFGLEASPLIRPAPVPMVIEERAGVPAPLTRRDVQ